MSPRRFLPVLVAAIALTASAVSTRTAIRGQVGDGRPRPVLRPGVVPIGSLGHTLGTYLTVEGTYDGVSKNVGISVEKVNGTPLPGPVWIHFEVSGLDDLRDGAKLVFKGYENAQMIGLPPAMKDAAQEAGEKPPLQPQAGWQLYLTFHVLKVIEPKPK
jgi:hypothetical protein